MSALDNFLKIMKLNDEDNDDYYEDDDYLDDEAFFEVSFVSISI